MAKIFKLDKQEDIIRGDTPLLTFPITVGGLPYDLTGWNARITITTSETPTSNANALVSSAPMDIDGNVLRYQLTTTTSKQFIPETTYYGDIEISKEPVETNTFTPIRFQFEPITDFGVS